MLYNEYIWTIPMIYISKDIQFSISNFLFKVFCRDSWIFDIYIIEKQTSIWRLCYKNLNQNIVMDFEWLYLDLILKSLYISRSFFAPSNLYVKKMNSWAFVHMNLINSLITPNPHLNQFNIQKLMFRECFIHKKWTTIACVYPN